MIVVRRIAAHEWPTYRDVRLRALQDSPDAFGSTYALEASRPDEAWASRIADAAASGADLALFAQIGGDICGLAWCKVSAEEPQLANLFQMWVAPEHRGQGVGRQLLTAATAWATAAGAKVLRLGVTWADTPAARLYAAHGFVPVGDPAPLRAGTELRAQTMELALER